MNTVRKMGAIACGLTALLGAVACESQVGEDYTGEVLFSLEGDVDLDPDTELQPALGFLTFDLDNVSSSNPFGFFSIAVVDGIVTGEFPSKFRLDVTQPPPESAFMLYDAPELREAFGMNGRFTVGGFVMLPADHPDQVSALDKQWDSDCDPDEDGCVFQETACASSGECRVRTMQCSTEPCEMVGTVGNSELESTIDGVLELGISTCLDRDCFSSDSWCSLDECYTELYYCDGSVLGPTDYIEWDTIRRCEVLSESGATDLVDLEETDSVASRYGVLYVTEDSPDSIFGPAKAGYNLIETPPATVEDFKAEVLCENDAERAAMQRFNEEHGTDYPINVYLSDAEDEELDQLIQEFQRDCPSIDLGQIVENQPITMELGGRLF